MRPSAEVRVVSQLVADGLCDGEIARRTGIPRGTVRHWRVGDRRAAMAGPCCGTCGEPTRLGRPEGPAYAYLLGLYLGDGHIAASRRGVWRLSIYLDEKYPGVIEECRTAMRQVIGVEPGAVAKRGCTDVNAYSKHWPCVFPQHGPGRKHERRIELVAWQRPIVDAHPESLVRGLIHSDGCRATNRVTVRGKRYAYPRYQFSNRSGDIRRIFCDACDRLGVEWRAMNAVTISVARSASVGRLDAFVGPKR